MLYALAAAIIAAAFLFLILKQRGASGRRGDLLGPPPDLAAKVRPAPSQIPTPRAGGGRPEGAPSIDDLAEEVAAAARQLVAQGRKIEAIKLVRTATRWSLTEAKEWVERL